jgi:hypothetical protein
MQSDPKKLTKAHHELTHSEDRKVMSHTQREQDDWFINSIMIEDCEVPFKFKRKSKYKTLLKGQRINLTYYPKTETVAGLDFETMRVVRIKSA